MNPDKLKELFSVILDNTSYYTFIDSELWLDSDKNRKKSALDSPLINDPDGYSTFIKEIENNEYENISQSELEDIIDKAAWKVDDIVDFYSRFSPGPFLTHIKRQDVESRIAIHDIKSLRFSHLKTFQRSDTFRRNVYYLTRPDSKYSKLSREYFKKKLKTLLKDKEPGLGLLYNYSFFHDIQYIKKFLIDKKTSLSIDNIDEVSAIILTIFDKNNRGFREFTKELLNNKDLNSAQIKNIACLYAETAMYMKLSNDDAEFFIEVVSMTDHMYDSIARLFENDLMMTSILKNKELVYKIPKSLVLKNVNMILNAVYENKIMDFTEFSNFLKNYNINLYSTNIKKLFMLPGAGSLDFVKYARHKLTKDFKLLIKDVFPKADIDDFEFNIDVKDVDGLDLLMQLKEDN